MDTEIIDIRKNAIDKILVKRDDSFLWGFDEKQARQRPEYLYYSPNFRSTLWTLILLADIKAPVDLVQIKPSLQIITKQFYDPEHGIFGFPGKSYFPIPCLNGIMMYFHSYFKTSHSEVLDKTIGFFAVTQRFDDGDFSTPKSFPYCSNTSCYGKHTCYWGVTKLLKGISFIPKHKRTKEAQQLAEKCINFILHHEVCFRSHNMDKFLHRDIDILTFPNFYKSDFLEILWLLAREEIQDRRMSRSLMLLRSKMKDGGYWELEKSMNIIVSIGQKNCTNVFITERATDVLGYYRR